MYWVVMWSFLWIDFVPRQAGYEERQEGTTSEDLTADLYGSDVPYGYVDENGMFVYAEDPTQDYLGMSESAAAYYPSTTDMANSGLSTETTDPNVLAQEFQTQLSFHPQNDGADKL